MTSDVAKDAVTRRTAECACGRVRVVVEGDPVYVARCHCDFCQKRTGSAFQVVAGFSEEQVVESTGETKIFNGLELDGEGIKVPGQPDVGVANHFCPTCGTAVYWFIDAQKGMRMIAVGCFVDPDFPAPTLDLFTTLRHHWVGDVPGAQTFEELPSVV